MSTPHHLKLPLSSFHQGPNPCQQSSASQQMGQELPMAPGFASPETVQPAASELLQYLIVPIHSKGTAHRKASEADSFPHQGVETVLESEGDNKICEGLRGSDRHDTQRLHISAWRWTGVGVGWRMPNAGIDSVSGQCHSLRVKARRKVDLASFRWYFAWIVMSSFSQKRVSLPLLVSLRHLQA